MGACRKDSTCWLGCDVQGCSSHWCLLGQVLRHSREAKLLLDRDRPSANLRPPPPPLTAQPVPQGEGRQRVRFPSCGHLPVHTASRPALHARLSGQAREGPLCKALGNHLPHFLFRHLPLPSLYFLTLVLSPLPPGWALPVGTQRSYSHSSCDTIWAQASANTQLGRYAAFAFDTGRLM